MSMDSQNIQTRNKKREGSTDIVVLKKERNEKPKKLPTCFIIQATLSSEELYNNVSHKRFFFFLTVPFLDFFQREGASAKVFLEIN